jgi:hypothetical protein
MKKMIFRKPSIKKIVTLSALCLTTGLGLFNLPPVAMAQYGLGISKAAGTGGATRGNADGLPAVTVLVPEDGAKTLSDRPTFYWYVAPNSANSKELPKLTFFLRNGNETSSKAVFTARGESSGEGLYKFTLPADAPALVAGKVQRWQLRLSFAANDVVDNTNVIALVRLDPDPEVSRAIAKASNNLEKARIYTQNKYWYDAIDSYTSWLSTNPEDKVAIGERSELLQLGLKNNIAFSAGQPNSLDKLIAKLDQSKTAIAIALQARTSR